MNPRGTTEYFNLQPGIEIQVSWPAQQLIGQMNVPEFLRLLADMMAALGAKQAYVSKSGAAVEIHILGPRDWTFHTQLKRGP